MRSAEGRITSGALLSRDLDIDRIPIGHRGPLHGIRQVMGEAHHPGLTLDDEDSARRFWLCMLDWPHDAPYQQRVTAEIAMVAQPTAQSRGITARWGLYVLEGGILAPVVVLPLALGAAQNFGDSQQISRIDIAATAVHLIATVENDDPGVETWRIDTWGTLTSRVVPGA